MSLRIKVRGSSQKGRRERLEQADRSIKGRLKKDKGW